MKGSAQSLSVNLALLALLTDFTLSANALTALGIPYVDDGGALAMKLHPGTYLAAFALAARFADRERPLPSIWRLACRERMLMLYLAALLFCVVYSLCLTGTGGLAPMLDTFLSAGLVAVALCDIDVCQLGRLIAIMRLLFMLNATLALGEAATGMRIVPLPPTITENGVEFRPAALYDHPLTGASATMVGLLLTPDGASSPIWRRVYQVWMWAALLAFGGRIALLLAFLNVLALHQAQLMRRALSRRLVAANLLPYAAMLVLIPAVIWIMSAQRLSSRLETHLYWDPSAQARIAEFHLVRLLNTQQLLFGCRRDDLIALIEPMRLAYGVDVIENFWLLLFATLGVLAFPVFVLGLAALVAWLLDKTDVPGRVMLVSLLLAASASNSLGRKSSLLAILVGAVLARSAPSQFTVGAHSARTRTRAALLQVGA